MRVASENRVPVAARAALTRAVTATDAQLSRTRTLERGEVVQTHALFRRIRRDGHRRRARRDGRATRRDARAGHRRRSLEGHLRRARIHARTRARQSSRTSQNDHTHHETPFPRPRSSPPPSRGRPASPARDRRRETLGHHPSRVRGPSLRPGHARDRRARPRARETSRNIFYARVVEIARTHRVRRERHHRRIRRIDNDVRRGTTARRDVSNVSRARVVWYFAWGIHVFSTRFMPSAGFFMIFTLPIIRSFDTPILHY